MKRFALGARVRVVQDGHPLLGVAGRVVRLRRADDGAWINAETDLPEGERSFPADDPHGRGNQFIAYPDECEFARVAPDEGQRP